MSKALLIQVTIFNQDTNEVVEQKVVHYDGSYAFEVEQIFDDIGTSVANIIDPSRD